MPAPKISLKARALRYLSAREHSRLELARKLGRHATESDNVDALLDQLEAARLLSEARFSESLVHRRSARFGNARILSELQSHGIDGAVLSSAKASLDSDETQRAREVLERKFTGEPTDAAVRAKRIRFMLQRGFTMHAIRAAMRGPGKNDDIDFAGEDDNADDIS